MQVALHSILTSWGDAGLEKHIRAVQAVYWRRASTLHQAAVTVRPVDRLRTQAGKSHVPDAQPVHMSSHRRGRLVVSDNPVLPFRDQLLSPRLLPVPHLLGYKTRDLQQKCRQALLLGP